jgi:hypothetical protein
MRLTIRGTMARCGDATQHIELDEDTLEVYLSVVCIET